MFEQSFHSPSAIIQRLQLISLKLTANSPLNFNFVGAKRSPMSTGKIAVSNLREFIDQMFFSQLYGMSTGFL